MNKILPQTLLQGTCSDHQKSARKTAWSEARDATKEGKGQGPMPRMWQGMYWAAVLCLTYHLLPLVPQGLRRNVGCLLQNLELQMKEMGQAYLACRSCLSFCNKMNTQIKEVDKRVDQLMGKLEENTAGLKKADEKIEEVKKAVGKV